MALRKATRGFDGHRHSVGVFDRALDGHGGHTMMRLEEASGLRHAVSQEPRLIGLSLGGGGQALRHQNGPTIPEFYYLSSNVPRRSRTLQLVNLAVFCTSPRRSSFSPRR
ncbi:MAG: hypothetical protein M3274_01315, partial [Actinomycetota bacterium]|nr:hypothetical protein [Actinomycetota bacterium]